MDYFPYLASRRIVQAYRAGVFERAHALALVRRINRFYRKKR